MSTLGPGIPVTPTVSVFGDGLPGFINRNSSHPGGIFGYSPEEEKKLVRKIDWRIIPILGLFYGASTLSKETTPPPIIVLFMCGVHHLVQKSGSRIQKNSTCVFLFTVFFLDRINLTNARMFAFQNALHATNEEFSWAIAVFYVGYGLAEIPSIIALLYLTPKVWLPASMFVW